MMDGLSGSCQMFSPNEALGAKVGLSEKSNIIAHKYYAATIMHSSSIDLALFWQCDTKGSLEKAKKGMRKQDYFYYGAHFVTIL